MSERYPGGIITKSPATPTGPYADGAAPGVWTLDQQLQYQQQGIWPTAGNIDPGRFIENIFSTYLYTGNGSTQTIINGLDLSTKGGLVWIKQRSVSGNHLLMTTNGGPTNRLRSNGVEAYVTSSAGRDFSSFNSNGFSLGVDQQSSINTSSVTYASWSFRKQPKFFDVVTYTGNGAATNSIAHNLNSMPGFIVVKRTNSTSDWHVVARYSDTNYLGGGSTNSFSLNTTDIANNGVSPTNRGITTTAFDAAKMYGGVGSFDVSKTNASGGAYIAYLFAHNAGGFGTSGTENVISCGSFTTDGSGVASVNLGFEPQWLLLKNSSISESWWLFDTMRGLTSSNTERYLIPDSSAAEGNATGVSINSTGFTTVNGTISNSSDYIYIAIRRGPMQTPTNGTSVYAPVTTTSSASPLTVTTNFPVDLTLGTLSGSSYDRYSVDRLRGSSTTATKYLRTNLTNAETTTSGFGLGFDNNTAIIDNAFFAGGPDAKMYWNFRRAPGFFDVVCYTGDGGTTVVQNHNLSVQPDLIIIKNRTNAANWAVASVTSGTTYRYGLSVNLTIAQTGTFNMSPYVTSLASQVYTNIGNSISETNSNGDTYVMYLFASCPGVSKVGSYTGTGTTLQVNCGFTGGARFVLIKRTDSTGDWYVWDSARGIVAGNDPYLLLNSTAAEVTNTDYVDTYSAGFEISSTAPAAINANGGTFIFLAIA